jgi:peptidoglycan pentaglycine glycine transferase (the first glycine)
VSHPKSFTLPDSESSWDSALGVLGGHLLQTWHWGAFKSVHGWSVERVAVGGDRPAAMAQVLFRSRGPFSIGYIPRGPAFTDGDPETLKQLFDRIDEVSRRRRAIYLIVEPDRCLPFKGSFKSEGFVKGPEHFQPCRTVKVPLLDDNELLGQMHQKTRYSVRLAERRGVDIRREGNDAQAIESFYRLLIETSDRNEFGIHSQQYYVDFMQFFGERALLLCAFVDGEPAAGLIAARFGREAVYMYGASSTIHRAHGAAFALQFEAMRWARDHGCTTYDLWGIPEIDPKTEHAAGDRVAGTKGDDWSGLYKFKVGFGGAIVSYPPTLERRYRPLLSFGARHLYANRSA